MKNYGIAILVVGLIILSLNSAISQTAKRPVLLVLSMDGFRWDYVNHAATPTLDSIAKIGVTGVIKPSFPSKTFPNHYTMATGLTPNSHGLLFNTFFAADLGKKYDGYKTECVQDARFYGGEPIWNTAQKQGLKSFVFFWVGSEAPINDMHPNKWFPYNEEITYNSRIDSVIRWLTSSVSERPNLIMLYNHEPDEKGHKFGPISDETSAEVERIDSSLAYLFRNLRNIGLAENVNIIITTDHGMCPTPQERYIDLSSILPREKLKYWHGESPVLNFNLKDRIDTTLFQAINATRGLTVYSKQSIPKRLAFGSNVRIMDYVMIADSAYSFGWGVKKGKYNKGNHGYDPDISDMQGIFYAIGPNFKKEVNVGLFNNTDLYNLMAKLLGIIPSKNDGNKKTFDAATINQQ
jgi:alkaline phosphatase D